MQIRVFPRKFFEARIGDEDAEILKRFNIISINTPWLHESPPFSMDLYGHQNLLVLYFDDVDNPSDSEQAKHCFMTKAHALNVFTFMGKCDKRRPLLVHCTAGVSRTGAVGEFLNWYYNRHLEDNQADFDYFVKHNPQIISNVWVKQKLY